MILAALNEAQIAGARLCAVCQVIGVSARTIQRWKHHPDGDDRRCGPQHRPGNALSAREELQVLAVMTSAEYGHLSPKQLVPRLADDGRYLASESTMYRLRRRVGLSARRPPVLRTEVTRATTVHHAVRSNQVWSWDITYLPTVTRGRFLRLYLVMDVWSRCIVGWEVHDDELSARAHARACGSVSPLPATPALPRRERGATARTRPAVRPRAAGHRSARHLSGGSPSPESESSPRLTNRASGVSPA